MGRITIFAIEECPFCQKAKGALKERNWPFEEISLTTHPSRRNDMLSLSDRLTVPQIFFNSKHIGGADDLLELLSEGGGDQHTTFDENYYKTTIANQPDPTDKRLRLSTNEPPVPPPKPPPPRPESDQIELPNGSKATVLQVMEELKTILPCQTLPYYLKYYTNCFTGAGAVDALTKHYGCTEDEAVAFGNRLLSKNHQILHHVVYDNHPFQNTNDYYFRLQCYQTPHILNSYRIWNITVDTNDDDEEANNLIFRFKKLLGKIERTHTNTSTGEVDYKKAAQHELFSKFEEEICELQQIDLGLLDVNHKIAFLLNLYNVGIKYAFIKVGIPTSNLSRSAFFTQIKFNIGGLLYSFQDIENGILRGNRRAPYSLLAPIGGSDPRHAFVLKPEEVDCRIHFALNCGAKSCPPVKTFFPTSLEEELRIVALAFAEDDTNVLLDSPNNKIYLNKILSWYMVDFASSEEELPTKIVTWLRGPKKEQLQTMMLSEGTTTKIKVEFLPYDWGTNASDFVPFDSGKLQAQYYSAKALF